MTRKPSLASGLKLNLFSFVTTNSICTSAAPWRIEGFYLSLAGLYTLLKIFKGTPDNFP